MRREILLVLQLDALRVDVVARDAETGKTSGARLEYREGSPRTVGILATVRVAVRDLITQLRLDEFAVPAEVAGPRDRDED